MNSLALIKIFSNPDLYNEKLEKERNENKESNGDVKDLLLFSLVCLQISYPKIYDVLTDNPNFLNWNKELAYNVTEGQEEKKENFKTDLNNISKKDQFNEEWECSLYRICYINPRYKSRAMDISKLFNFINDKLLINCKNNTDKENFIQETINQTVVTSISATDDSKSHTLKPFERQILSDPEEGLALYFSHNAKGAKLDNTRKVIRHIDKDIRGYFKNYTVIYSKSMGATIYKDYNNNKTSKIGAIDIQTNSLGERIASFSLYRNPKNDFKKPLVGDLETKNHLPPSNYRNVAWYKLLIPSIDKFEEFKSTIYQLIELSSTAYDLRKEDAKNILIFKPQDVQDSDGIWPNADFKKYVNPNHTYRLV